MSKNLSQLSRRQGVANTLFQTLVLDQNSQSPDQRTQLAKDNLIGEAIVHGTASFYDFIDGDNANKKAYVCNGSSCLCAGTQDSVTEQLSQQFSFGDIGHVTCLGRCAQNSAFQISGENFSGNDIAQLKDIISKKEENNLFVSTELYHVECSLEEPILTAEIENIEQYYGLVTRLLSNNTADELLDVISESGLRGRGGAGFPTGFKWKSCREAKNSQQSLPLNNQLEEKYIVCNADEGDAGAYSDRYLLEQRPHAVLFGMLMAGILVGAKTGILYIRNEYPAAIKKTAQAIAEFNQLLPIIKAQLLNENENENEKGEIFDFSFKIIKGAGAYICGEETALLRSIEGQRPVVSVRPPFPTQSGLFGCPTVLNNVETFASIHFILNDGMEDFKALGNGKSTGSKLISLDSSFNKPGIYEVAMGTPLHNVIDMAGGYSKSLKALHIGGPLGGVVPLEYVDKLTVDFESFTEAGFLLGHASVIGLGDDLNLIEYIEHLFEFTALESCGKCYPCQLGSVRGQEMLNNAISGKQLINKQLLNDLLETMELGSLCALGGGVPLPISNILHYFADEIKPYFQQDKDQVPVQEKLDLAKKDSLGEQS